jgi:hypothetical protein
MKRENEFTAQEAAAALGITHSRMRQLLNTGQITARHEGDANRKTWYITRETIEEHKQERATNPPRPGWKAGRPRK